VKPTIADYVVVLDPPAGDSRPLKPYLAIQVGGRLVRQSTSFEQRGDAEMFAEALEDAKAALADRAPLRSTSPASQG
jgi:hypothetical protein